MFSRADKDKDGQIDAMELKKFLELLGEHVSENNVVDLLKEIDTDANGVSSYVFQNDISINKLESRKSRWSSFCSV